jgi:hypothetical protein
LFCKLMSYRNIWAPELVSGPSNLKSVIVWFYGGYDCLLSHNP